MRALVNVCKVRNLVCTYESMADSKLKGAFRLTSTTSTSVLTLFIADHLPLGYLFVFFFSPWNLFIFISRR